MKKKKNNYEDAIKYVDAGMRAIDAETLNIYSTKKENMYDGTLTKGINDELDRRTVALEVIWSKLNNVRIELSKYNDSLL